MLESNRTSGSLVIRETSAAFADLGTFLPLTVGLIVISGMSATGLLFGFGMFALATAFMYRRPIPVQPMKAVAAAGIAGLAGPEVLIATGMMLGLTLVVLSQTQAIGLLKRCIPNTVLYGMRLALAASLVATALNLQIPSVWGVITLLLVLTALQYTSLRNPSCFIVLVGGWIIFGSESALVSWSFGWHLPAFELPPISAFWGALEVTYLPQLALTLTNALILTAVIAQDYFPDQKAQLTEQRFALSSGFANVLLAPFGAMPMCHGAGGLAAHHGLGSTTGWSVAIFGMTCLVLALLFGDEATHILTAVPMEVVVALVLYAAWVLADPIKLSKLRPSCLCIILFMVPVTLFSGLLAALVVGLLLEWFRVKRSDQASNSI